MLETLLKEVGLDSDEAALYLALVEEKEATASHLAGRSRLPRTYAYPVLERLVKKGLVAKADTPRAIRRYSITDFEAPKRLFEQRQFQLFKTAQTLEKLRSELEKRANPDIKIALVESLADNLGEEDFWKLLHSTITREICIINPPSWWSDQSHAPSVEKWKKYREKQHIWERRFFSAPPEGQEKPPPFTELHSFKKTIQGEACLVLVDHYQVQISSWKPFRALRIASQELVDLIKATLE